MLNEEPVMMNMTSNMGSASVNAKLGVLEANLMSLIIIADITFLIFMLILPLNRWMFT